VTKANSDLVAAENTVARMNVVDTEVFQRFLAAADDDVSEKSDDDVSMEIIARILSATTAEEVLGGSEPVHARDYLGRPFRLLGVKFNRSDFEEAGPRFYAVLDAVDPDGEPLAITCGARNVIAQAWRLADLGVLPIRVRLTEAARTTKNGYKIIRLESMGPDF